MGGIRGSGRSLSAPPEIPGERSRESHCEGGRTAARAQSTLAAGQAAAHGRFRWCGGGGRRGGAVPANAASTTGRARPRASTSGRGGGDLGRWERREKRGEPLGDKRVGRSQGAPADGGENQPLPAAVVAGL